MDRNNQNLTKRQLKAIPIILAENTISDGARKAGISRTTLYEWLKDPCFRSEYASQRRAVIELALDSLKLTASDAVEVLRNLLVSESDAIRLRASMGILDHIAKFVELEDLERRVDDLERSFNNE